MALHFELGDIPVEVVKKDIKNIHLSVYQIGRASCRERVCYPV